MSPLERSEWHAGADVVTGWWTEARHARDALPWREERDPWKVLVVEVMLAQTQAARVAERYPAVIAAMHSVKASADLTTAQLMELWSGLGYYRRALSLRESAVIIRDRHAGKVPVELAELLALPGVGPYTARAVLAFAVDRPVGVLDTNIGRVLARAVVGQAISRSNAQHLVDELVQFRSPREWNLALMDFGAMVCTARIPRCAECPIGAARFCRWQLAGGPDPSIRSAATSRPQSRFRGSDREGRGKLLRAALMGPIAATALGEAAGWPDDPERAARVANQLVREGLLAISGSGEFDLATERSGLPVAR